MGRAEGVVDVDVRHVGQRLGEAGLVRLLLAVEAQVLQQQHVAGPQLVDRGDHAGAERVAGHPHGAAEQLARADRRPASGAARR